MKTTAKRRRSPKLGGLRLFFMPSKNFFPPSGGKKDAVFLIRKVIAGNCVPIFS